MKHPLLLTLLLFVAASCTQADPSAPLSAPADTNCDIQWNAVAHDSFDPSYRSVGGPITPGTALTVRLRVAQGDLSGARVRVWDDQANRETYYPMQWDQAFDTDATTYDWWAAALPASEQPTILYYLFELNDAGGSCTADQDFYVDDDIQFYGGGLGIMLDAADTARSFQLTVYDPAFRVPTWMQRGIAYQVFPDRFRDGNPSNNPQPGRFAYGVNGGALVRSGQQAWNSVLCDPRASYQPACPERYGDNFYGGDLAGITQQIEAGYFDQLGVSVLYLNPIFRSPSNHKYDTADYLSIDPDFGTLEDFQRLVAAANAHNIQLILDGVFNHVSSDSTYFDAYQRYDASGQQTSPAGPGQADGSGACESSASPYYNWFIFPAENSAGGTCPNGPNGAQQSYEAWYGYGSLPKLRSGEPAVRELLWSAGARSVGPYWVAQGARGWRFDVGADVDPGLTNAPENSFWEGFRAAVREQSVTGTDEVLLLGEEWGDASAWLLGGEWDSVMNYRLRAALLGWLFTGCAGQGCTDGVRFEDNDNNPASASGAISALSPSLFNARLLSIWEDYPPPAFKALLNLTGSHDTNRLRFVLKKINRDNDDAAIQRMKEAWIFLFTYAGTPTIYYGDEVGLSHDGVFANGKLEDDPYNRAPLPWPDTPGAYVPLPELHTHLSKLAQIRRSSRALQDGEVQHGLIIDDARQLYGFARTSGTELALIALNRSASAQNALFQGLNAAPFNLPDGSILRDALSGETVVVQGGQASVIVPSSWGVILLREP